jgi:hypothetical protein
MQFRPGLTPQQAGPPAQPAQPSALQRALPSGPQVRQILEGAGGAIGTAAALPSAAVSGPAGPIAGGGLGAAGGSLLAETFDLLGGGIGLRAPGAGRALQTKLLGITPQAILDFEQAALKGVRLGIEQVSESGLVRRFRNVAGRFPPLAGPLQRGQKRLGVEAAGAIRDTVDSIAPVGHFVDLGANFSQAASKNIRALRGVINSNYERFTNLATRNDARVPLKASVAMAKDIMERGREFGGIGGRAMREAEKVLKLGVKEVAESPILGPGGETVRRGAQERVPIDVRLWRGKVQELDKAIRQLSDVGDTTGAGELAQLRKAMESDLQGLQGPPEVLAALGEANASFERFARLFRDVPQGQRLQRGVPQLFGSLKGSRGIAQIEVDRLYETVFKQQIRSPQAMEDLARIVGDPKLMKRAGTSLIHDVGADAIRINEETGETFLNLRKLTGDLGLFDNRSPKRRSLEITIGRENLKNLEETVRAIERVADTSFINVSDFVARRGLLGGARSVIRSFTPGVDTEGNLSDVIMNGRRFGEFITDPKAMRAFADVMKPVSASSVDKLGRLTAKAQVAKAGALMRFARVMPQFFDVEGTGEGLLPVTQREGLAGGSIRQFARLGNLAPFAVGTGAAIPRATRGFGRALAGVTAGEFIQDLEDTAVAFRKRGQEGERAFNDLAGRKAKEIRERNQARR